jgi:hypothetical protein
MKFIGFFLIVHGIFALLGPDPEPNRSESETLMVTFSLHSKHEE